MRDTITVVSAAIAATLGFTGAFVLLWLICKSVKLCPLGRSILAGSVVIWLIAGYTGTDSALRHSHANATWHAIAMWTVWALYAAWLLTALLLLPSLRRTLRGHRVAMALRRARRHNHHRHHHNHGNATP